MPAAAPVSMREVPWELSRTSTSAGLVVLLRRVQYWVRALALATASESKAGGKQEGKGVASESKDGEDGFARVFACEAPTVNAAARKKFIKQLAAKREAQPDIWTNDVASALRDVLKVLDDFIAKREATQALKKDGDTPAVPNMDVNVDDISFAGCDPMFVDAYRRFYARDASEVLAAVNKALTDLKTSKENRPLTIAGNGADHILHVVNLRAGSELLLQSVRLLAEAALHDSTEATFFEKGAVEAAMRIGRECKDMEIRCHAARLFFNLAYLKANRPAFIKKGGLHHISYLARTTDGDTSTGNAQKLILFAAKTMYQLSCADACAKRVFYYSGFEDLWLTFAQHPTQDVRQRAAGVFNKVVELKICSRKVHSGWCRFLVEEVLHGMMSNDSNNNASQAQKKARSIANQMGWRSASSRR